MDTEFDELYSIREYRHSPDGILASVLGGISAFAFLALALICMILKGQGAAWTGSFGFTAFFLAFTGMIKGLRSFRDPCVSYLFSKIGTLTSGVMVAVWFLIYCVGLSA